jgi:hypothetical protein
VCIGEIIKYLHITTTPTNPNDTDPTTAAAIEASQEVNTSQFIRMKDQLLDLLTERHRDVSTFTRTAVLKVWCSLVEANIVEVSRYNTVVDIALDRMMDKTAAVRKASIQLLTMLLDSNPFSSTLDVEYFKAALVKVEETQSIRMIELREVYNKVNMEEDKERPIELVDEEFLCSASVKDDEKLAEIQLELNRVNTSIVFIAKCTDAVAR